MGKQNRFSPISKNERNNIPERSTITFKGKDSSQMRILQYPNELLKTRCEEVDWNSIACKETVDMLRSTVQLYDGEREILGLAANQIGMMYRVFYLNNQLTHGDHDIFINPELIYAVGSNSEYVNEACMSFPDTVKIRIKRFFSIRVRFTNEHGKQLDNCYTGLAAQAVQHEIDHLNGITLFQNSSDKGKKDILKKIERARHG